LKKPPPCWRAAYAYYAYALVCASTMEPRNGRVAYVEAPSDLGQRFPSSTSAQSLSALVSGKRGLAPEPHTIGLCPSTALCGSGEDQMALELGQTTKHRDHQPPMQCRYWPIDR
jgi:hypothetical protein